MNHQIIVAGHHTISSMGIMNPFKICEDYHLIKANENQGLYAFSVADGAGSSEYGGMGAKIACETICELIFNGFDSFFVGEPQTVKEKIIFTIRTSLELEATKMNSPIEEFASTLMFIAIKNEKILVGHIGDGLIAYNKNGLLEILSHPENGEFPNQTYFVTSKHYLHHFRIYRGGVEAIDALYLLTDGIANLYYSPKQKALNPSFNKVIEKLRSESSEELANKIKNVLNTDISKRTNDDSTLLVAFINK